MAAPFVPESVDNFDEKVSNDGWNDEGTDKMKEAALLVQDESVQEMFNGYYYDKAIENFTKAQILPSKKEIKKPSSDRLFANKYLTNNRQKVSSSKYS